MNRNYIDIKETLLKYDMEYIFAGISDVYGDILLDKFVSYVKEMYGLDPSYNFIEVIDTMSEDEIILNINVFFDSEDERHISEIGVKDKCLEKLISYLESFYIKSIPTYNEWITFEEGCELPDEWEGVIVAAPQHKSKIMHCVYTNGEFHTLGIKDHVIIPKKFMRIDTSNITIKDDYTYGKKISKE